MKNVGRKAQFLYFNSLEMGHSLRNGRLRMMSDANWELLDKTFLPVSKDVTSTQAASFGGINMDESDLIKL